MEKTCSQKNNVKTGLKRRTHTGLLEKSTEEAVSSKTQKQTVL